ncbi:MAG: sigma 54-interacting transcriptional regulator [bacterium]
MKTIVLPAGLVVLFCALALLPFPWNEGANDLFITWQFKIRGERHLSDEFVLVYIDAEDIQTLGGWPLTHDYYGYITHALTSLGARVIGFNLLFDSADPRFPEYDDILVDFVQTAGNVCLPFAFYRLTAPSHGQTLLAGETPVFPLAELRDHAQAIGFSNLPSAAMHHRTPLLAAAQGDTLTSFGVALAQSYLRADDGFRFSSRMLTLTGANERLRVVTDENGQLRLNHFGGIDRLHTIGFLDLMQAFEAGSDSLMLEGKIVLIDVTAPGIPTLASTPLAAALPTSLIHATVAENIIHQNFLREAPAPVLVILIATTVCMLWFWGQTKPRRLNITGALSVLLFLWCLAQMLFSLANFVLPLFYPTLAILATAGLSGHLFVRRMRSDDVIIKRLLQQEISKKETELARARSSLAHLEQQLQDESVSSDDTNRLAEARRHQILEMEKQLDDMHDYVTTAPSRPKLTFSDIICHETSPMGEVLELISKVAADDIPVLILGERGTGKEMVARAIHQSSERKHAPFVAVNCGALPETLLESELFGYEKGSLTGAQSRRKGRFELADRGTIFLDEITETSTRLQSQLLRVLQEGRFERLGGDQTIAVDVRVVAATTRDVMQEGEQGPFRADLFFRLNGFPITLPPLRERLEDIPPLTRHFLPGHGYESVTAVSERAMEVLKSYAWPGNVRELENAVRGAAMIAQSKKRRLIQPHDLPQEIQNASGQLASDSKSLEEQILASLRAHKFSRTAISKTAEALGNCDRETLAEYFRGLCFQQMVQKKFNLEQTVTAVAGSRDGEILQRVRNKLEEYIRNLHPLPNIRQADLTKNKGLPSQFKGLPNKFHPYLWQVIEHLLKRKRVEGG